MKTCLALSALASLSQSSQQPHQVRETRGIEIPDRFRMRGQALQKCNNRYSFIMLVNEQSFTGSTILDVA